MADQPANRPNFELVQLSEDEWVLLTVDGQFGAAMTAEQVEALRAAMESPIPLD